METWEVVIICLLALLIGIAILMLTDVKEKLRRKKHPVWYKHYDRAVHNAFDIGGRLREQTEVLHNRLKLLNKTYLNDKCTEAEYLEAARVIAKEYAKVVKRYKQAEEDLHIEEDLKEADAYAKERNLKWGILY